MVLIAPTVVYERASVDLSVKNVPYFNANTQYWWKFPDMSIYGQQSGYGVDVHQSDADFTLTELTMHDKGLYIFTVKDDDCGVFQAKKHIEVLPLPTPCFDDIEPNKLLVRDSATGIESLIDCFVDVFNADNSGIKLSFKGPMFTYDLEVEFPEMPEETSTFYLKNYYENGTDQNIPDNDLTQAYIAFQPSTSTVFDYRLIPLTEDIHFKREGNQITLTLCSVRFKFGSKIKYITAKMVFQI
jgi:hypothetical protein